MTEKICLITGATSGIGKETAIALAKAGMTLVLTARDEGKGERTKKEIIDLSQNRNVEVLPCDLSSLSSVKNFCSRFQENHENLHVLINNAGVWEKERKLSKDGIEVTFATNFLAPFLMTNLLMDTLKKSAPARIISTTSGLHGGTIRFDDVEFKSGFRGMSVYRQSKLAIVLFTKELAKRLKGTEVTANCFMPGLVYTGLFRNASALTRMIIKSMATTSPRKAARTPVYLATSLDVERISGECFKKERMIAKTSEESHDNAAMERLWALGLDYVKDWV